ncbi:MAG: hypothetical protein IPP63_04775 [Chloracidobacterium sp.]|nr:hypothetical protein [Chloracidobacterium sp.]
MKEWIALNMTPGVGPRAATKLLERFGSRERFFTLAGRNSNLSASSLKLSIA